MKMTYHKKQSILNQYDPGKVKEAKPWHTANKSKILTRYVITCGIFMSTVSRAGMIIRKKVPGLMMTRNVG